MPSPEPSSGQTESQSAPLSNPLDPRSPEGRSALASLIRRDGGLDVRIASVEALSGGASSATWLVDTETDAGPRRFIFQRSAAAGHGLSRAVQAEVQRRAGSLGVPVAPVIAIAGPADQLGDAVVTGFVEGEALAPRWLRQPDYARARELLTSQCAEALARLHAAPLAHWDGLPLTGGSGAELLANMFAMYRRIGVDVPAFDLAFAWLKPRMPDTPATTLVHGDFRSGNFLVAAHGLTAVLDWEIPHVSVPAEDLAWLCASAWRFGQWQKPVGGFGDRADLIAAYRAHGGTLEAEDLHIWEVYGNLRWGMSCLQLADDHVSGRVPSVERAAIGRRVSEVAADLTYAIAFGDL
jgi:aminoglycoside phosphotransferase (APT) family kinase protein